MKLKNTIFRCTYLLNKQFPDLPWGFKPSWGSVGTRSGFPLVSIQCSKAGHLKKGHSRPQRWVEEGCADLFLLIILSSLLGKLNGFVGRVSPAPRHLAQGHRSSDLSAASTPTRDLSPRSSRSFTSCFIQAICISIFYRDSVFLERLSFLEAADVKESGRREGLAKDCDSVNQLLMVSLYFGNSDTLETLASHLHVYFHEVW